MRGEWKKKQKTEDHMIPTSVPEIEHWIKQPKLPKRTYTKPTHNRNLDHSNFIENYKYMWRMQQPLIKPT